VLELPVLGKGAGRHGRTSPFITPKRPLNKKKTVGILMASVKDPSFLTCSKTSAYLKIISTDFSSLSITKFFTAQAALKQII